MSSLDCVAGSRLVVTRSILLASCSNDMYRARSILSTFAGAAGVNSSRFLPHMVRPPCRFLTFLRRLLHTAEVKITIIKIVLIMVNLIFRGRNAQNGI